MPYYVYILFSESLGKYYIGSSGNVTERLRKHLTKHSGFTGRAKDWEIVYKKDFENKQAALLKEKEIKNWKSIYMVEKLINETNTILSKVNG